MLIKDILLRDPSQQALVNNGQARITNEAADENVSKELRGELSTFVCEGQYEDGIVKILSSFLASRNIEPFKLLANGFRLRKHQNSSGMAWKKGRLSPNQRT